MLDGIDFAFGSGLTTAQIKSGGKSFVCRYLSGGSSKDINGTELANYKAAGIAVVFVWETGGLMPSEAQGIADARAAQGELNALATAIRDPSVAEAVVFFAADAASEGDLRGYMTGALSVLGGRARTGIYGGLGSVSAAFNAGLAGYGWQTYAWSGTPPQWDDRALLRQVQNGVRFGPATVDLDQAAYWNSTRILGPGDDFGQWPRPVPPPSGPYRHVVPAGNRQTIEDLAGARRVSPQFILDFSRPYLSPQNLAVLEAFLALDTACAAAGIPRPPMPAGLVYWTANP